LARRRIFDTTVLVDELELCHPIRQSGKRRCAISGAVMLYAKQETRMIRLPIDTTQRARFLLVLPCTTHKTRFGSVRDLLGAQTGHSVASFDYDPYGNVTRVKSSTLSDFRFAGLFYEQNTGLYLAKHRTYDARTARWLSRDPIGERAGGNLYRYVSDSPTNAVDPFGMFDVFGFGGATFGGESTYGGYFTGTESTVNPFTGQTQSSSISITEGSIGAEIPGVAGVSFGSGTYETEGESGVFGFIGGGVLGEEGSVGFGFSIPESPTYWRYPPNTKCLH
jgi:RHS repeat-associated protein